MRILLNYFFYLIKMKNYEIFYNLNCHSLKIGSNSYELIRDSPCLLKVISTLTPIVGCPVIPSLNWKQSKIF